MSWLSGGGIRLASGSTPGAVRAGALPIGQCTARTAPVTLTPRALSKAASVQAAKCAGSSTASRSRRSPPSAGTLPYIRKLRELSVCSNRKVAAVPAAVVSA